MTLRNEAMRFVRHLCFLIKKQKSSVRQLQNVAALSANSFDIVVEREVNIGVASVAGILDLGGDI